MGLLNHLFWNWTDFTIKDLTFFGSIPETSQWSMWWYIILTIKTSELNIKDNRVVINVKLKSLLHKFVILVTWTIIHILLLGGSAILFITLEERDEINMIRIGDIFV